MRSFTTVSAHRGSKNLNLSGGRYISDTPVAAAKKAFSQIVQTNDFRGKVSLKITIKETTRGSAHKEYTYKVSKVPEITEVDLNGTIVRYTFTTKVKAL